jgi:hypothetical protein
MSGLIHATRKRIFSAKRNKILHGKKSGGGITVQKSGVSNENASPMNGIVGLNSKPMDVNPAKQFKPSGTFGPVNLTGQSASLLGSGLHNISFKESKSNKKAKLKM